MKRFRYEKILLIGLIALLLSACGLLDDGDPQPIPLPATTQVETIVPPEATSVVIVPTALPTEAITGKPEATQTATTVPIVTNPVTPTPIAVPDNCVAPNPPEGAFFITYGVQHGDTLFTIGQSTRPTMSVEQIAAANCIVDVNRIEVGQQLLIWHSPAGNPDVAVTQVEWQPGRFASYNYSGPLAFGEHHFVFNGLAGEILSLHNYGDFDINQSVELVKNDSGEVVGSVPFLARTYLDLAKRGGGIRLPADGEYRLVFTGRSGSPLNFELQQGGIAEVVLGKPEPIQFAAGASSADISGVHPHSKINRYMFTASAGQELTLTPGDLMLTLLVEDPDDLSAKFFLLRADGEIGKLTLPKDGDYIISTCFCRWEGSSDGFGYRFGDAYTFNIAIVTPQSPPTITPTPTPAPATGPSTPQLQFNPGMNGWQMANAVGTIDETGQATFNFTVAGSDHLSLTERGFSNLTFELVTADDTRIGAVATYERHYLMPELRGRGFDLPANTDYQLKISGVPGSTFDAWLVFGGVPHPTLAIPQRVEFAAGADSAHIAGETVQQWPNPGVMDRYFFTASAGQTVSITNNAGNQGVVWIEDSNRNVFLKTDLGQTQAILQADGDYVLTVWHPGGAVYGFGPYDFNLTINDVQPEVIVGAPQPITFAAGTTSAQIRGVNAPTVLDQYVFQASAGQTIELTHEQMADGDLMVYDIIDQNNNLLYRTNQNPTLTFTAGYTGEYYIVVGGMDVRNSRIGDYMFDISIVN